MMNRLDRAETVEPSAPENLDKIVVVKRSQRSAKQRLTRVITFSERGLSKRLRFEGLRRFFARSHSHREFAGKRSSRRHAERDEGETL